MGQPTVEIISIQQINDVELDYVKRTQAKSISEIKLDMQVLLFR